MASWKGRVLEVQERLDDSLWVELDGDFRRAIPAPERPVVLRAQSCDQTTVKKSLTG